MVIRICDYEFIKNEKIQNGGMQYGDTNIFIKIKHSDIQIKSLLI